VCVGSHSARAGHVVHQQGLSRASAESLQRALLGACRLPQGEPGSMNFDPVLGSRGFFIFKPLLPPRPCQVEYLRLDEDYRKYIYRVLHSYADEVEYIHRSSWKSQIKGDVPFCCLSPFISISILISIFPGMTDDEKWSFRRRLDTILFRLDNRLYDATESQYDHPAAIFYLFIIYFSYKK
jgi:hypothetical protein